MPLPASAPRGRPYVVYCVADVEADALKIGKSSATQLKRRLETLQTGNPRQLQLVYTLWADNEGLAAALETGLHGYFEHLRLRGDVVSLGSRDRRRPPVRLPS